MLGHGSSQSGESNGVVLRGGCELNGTLLALEDLQVETLQSQGTRAEKEMKQEVSRLRHPDKPGDADWHWSIHNVDFCC